MKHLFLYDSHCDDAVDASIAEEMLSKSEIAFAYEGIPARMLEFVKRTQVGNTALWKNAVGEFRARVDGTDGRWRGEFWGKLMRSAALVYSVNREDALYEILRDTTEELLITQDEHGRIATYDTQKEFYGWDMWTRKYVLIGLLYFYGICREEELRARVMDAMCRHADYIIAHVGEGDGKLSICNTSKWYGGLNSCSILEPIVKLYRLSGESRYLEFASYIVSQGACRGENDLFALALEDTVYPYQYPYTKAYEMMSCFEGLIEYAEVTGDSRCRQAAENFAYRVAQTEISVIGGGGCSMECFDHGAVRQTSFGGDRAMQETCVTVTWMRFCCRMFELTGKSFFIDSFEQSFYNAYAGSFNTQGVVNDAIFPPYIKPEKGLIPTMLPFDSYSPLRRGTRGNLIAGALPFVDRSYYGCCAAIGGAGIGCVGSLTAQQLRNGIALQLYFAGTMETLTPQGQRLKLVTETAYPQNGRVQIKLSLPERERFTVCLRIPAWSRRTSLRINGEATEVSDGYTSICREWADGDTILLDLDMRIELLKAPQFETDAVNCEVDWNTGDNIREEVTQPREAKHFVALRYGPLMLARDARTSKDFSTVEPQCDAEGFVNAGASDAAMTHLVAFQIPQNNAKPFCVVDYCSAGSTWDKASEFEVWLPIEDRGDHACLEN